MPEPAPGQFSLMKTVTNLYTKVCSFDNLKDAYFLARKHKTSVRSVQEFHEHWQLYLVQLMKELRNKTYSPLPLRTFVLRDPKTRTICASAFRDRVVHHALVNVLKPVFEPRFIHDSYASRVGKGTLPAIERLKVFMRQVTENGTQAPYATGGNHVRSFVLKADIYHYFESVDHQTLLEIVNRHVLDKDVLWLIKLILQNFSKGKANTGMPLGNWTSQFFANVYLNELDQFVKHTLKAKYYIRYVDDFVILHTSEDVLRLYQQQIKEFLQTLKLTLHPQKCVIKPLRRGISFLGYTLFYKYTRVRTRNIRKIKNRLQELLADYRLNNADATAVLNVLQGWCAYSQHANTYNLRKKISQQVL
ncbi:MAG: reverse transcriptase domain-containing protein, partial [Candidatus Woesearchaeota archaeon]|nr:reverse transcriptase domain-containing protein [Candidatus Woesearchaeota archaeon]